MSVQLLDKTRKINKLLHNNNSSKVVFNDICEVLTEILDSNILVISKKGKVLGSSQCRGIDEIHELIEQFVCALRALIAQVFMWMRLEVIIKSEEERLQLQSHYSVGHGIVFDGKVEGEDSEHAVNNLVDQLRVSTSTVGFERIIYGMFDVEACLSQDITTVPNLVSREVVVHLFETNHISREKNQYAFAFQFPMVKIDAYGSSPRVAIDDSAVINGAYLVIAGGGGDRVERSLFHVAKLRNISQIVKF